jgi:hypothetical protein
MMNQSDKLLKHGWKTLRPLGWILLIIGFVVSLALLAACNFSSGPSPEFAATKAALDVQATQLAAQIAQSSQQTQIAFNVQATVVAQQAMQLTALAHTPAGIISDQPAGLVATEQPTQPPTDTPAPTDTPELEPTEVPPTPTPDFEEWKKSAKILVFEDIASVYLDRYIKQSLDSMGLPYVDVKDAIGDFKAQLLSGTDWDLVISGVEARSGVRGEFFDYLNDQLNNGTSVILEIWTLDEIAGGKISPLLIRCGVKFQKDWWEPPSETRSIWWLAPEHPIFHEPNEGMSLAHYDLYWTGDAGDFIKLAPGGDATLLAGNLAWEKNSYGTLAVCIDDRFIIQTHSSHDYHKEDVIPLWQNYIYYELKKQFESGE